MGASIQDAALRDFSAGQIGKVSFGTRLAQGLSAIILVIPYALMLGGLALCALNFPNLITLVLGGTVSAVGFYVRPRRHRLEGEVFTRSDLPELFALTDEISQRLGGKPVTKVQIFSDFNAFSTELQGDRVLGIGLGLWLILSPEERVALIAHEVSHQVNGDQARTGLLSMGLYSVERWYSLFEDSAIVDHEGYYLREQGIEDAIGGGLAAVVAMLVEQLWLVLKRFSFLDSQRAEYLADGIATKAAGIEAVQKLLRKLGYERLLRRAFLEMAPNLVPNGTAFFDQLCGKANSATVEVRAGLEARMAEEVHCVDMSHPPTVERIGFLAKLTKTQDAPISYREKIDAELAPFIEAEGVKMLQMLEVQ
ncbi:MAG: M48 family metalloprotease [Litoreibacter sp.]|uniref:M48 family metalloprotease n=1 Tax=Litoreibacter sp. TaxID=1969459 RepID=UPI003297E841